MARMVKQQMTAGAPEKPAHLTENAAEAWDRIILELAESGIQVSRAHRSLIEQAAEITADIIEAREVIRVEGAYVENEKTGASQAHPAAKRLDALRRDYIKVMSLIGLRAPVSGGKGEGDKSLEDLLKG